MRGPETLPRARWKSHNWRSFVDFDEREKRLADFECQTQLRQKGGRIRCPICAYRYGHVPHNGTGR
eukprot:624989-Prymnesium_polylepis.1